MRTDDTTRSASLQRVAVFLVIVVGAAVFLMVRSTLTPPEDAPAPRTACERGQSTAHTAGRESWC